MDNRETMKALNSNGLLRGLLPFNSAYNQNKGSFPFFKKADFVFSQFRANSGVTVYNIYTHTNTYLPTHTSTHQNSERTKE